jgi:glycerate 2-kinase
MAAGCEAALGDACAGGLVVVADGCSVPLRGIDVAFGSHPIPDQRSFDAANLLAGRMVASRDPVICTISGGASSLVVQPRPPVTLADKIAVNRLLLACGADIADVNVVRKHLSGLKGGGLLRLIKPRPLVTLLLSDVVGDDPSLIGSGPTTADPSTFSEARAILEKFAILDHVSQAVRDLLDRGIRGDVDETVKAADPAAVDTESVVIGNNRLALEAAAAEARRLGYEPVLEPTPLIGDTTQAAQRWLDRIAGDVDGRRVCAIVGGETTVTLRGAGRGGRNQEFALALAERLAGRSIAVLSAGTDGIDGPTDAAGAWVDGRTMRRSEAIGLHPRSALATNDSYGFFDPLGDLLRCGPTGTNVTDIKLAVGLPS